MREPCCRLTAPSSARCHEVVNNDLTVRDTEALVKVQANQTPAQTPPRTAKTPDVARLETHLGNC